jgi:FADH2 O2-dependent halogenase
LGRTVALIEKGRHPRFAIGESSTPLANLMLEQIAEEYDLPVLKPFTKYGSWIEAHPEIAVGLKRGFTFYHHEFDQPFTASADHARELLVGASPNDAIGDTHWYRPHFDAFLFKEAERMGVTCVEEAELWGADTSAKRPIIQGRHRGQPLEVHAGLLIDASGPRGFLHRSLELPEVPFKKIPPTASLYSHFKGVKRWEVLHRPNASGALPPYAPDDAALHHVFDGGWIWVLRFNNGITSAGAALEKKLAAEMRIHEGAAAWDRLLARLPSIREQFAGAEAVVPFVHTDKLSFLSGFVAGENWVLLPSAAGFIDPLLSTGFPLTLLGVERLARVIKESWDKPGMPEELFGYSMQTTVELVTTERLIAALYATMHDFELFRALTLLYFAAASFTEAARRLGKAELAGNTFLLGEHPVFGPRFRYCVDTALQQPEGDTRALLLARIRETTEPVNVAQLGNPERRHWYPALAADLLAGADKLQSTPDELEAMLRRCGFPATA